MEQDLQKNNFGNEALIQVLMDRGAKEIFSLTIPNHRLPSINAMNAAQHWQRKKIKDEERKAFDIALSSQATERA